MNDNFSQILKKIARGEPLDLVVPMLLYKPFPNVNKKVFTEAGNFVEDKKLCSKLTITVNSEELKKVLTNAEHSDSKTSGITCA